MINRSITAESEYTVSEAVNGIPAIASAISRWRSQRITVPAHTLREKTSAAMTYAHADDSSNRAPDCPAIETVIPRIETKQARTIVALITVKAFRRTRNK